MDSKKLSSSTTTGNTPILLKAKKIEHKPLKPDLRKNTKQPVSDSDSSKDSDSVTDE